MSDDMAAYAPLVLCKAAAHAFLCNPNQLLGQKFVPRFLLDARRPDNTASRLVTEPYKSDLKSHSLCKIDAGQIETFTGAKEKEISLSRHLFTKYTSEHIYNGMINQQHRRIEL